MIGRRASCGSRSGKIAVAPPNTQQATLVDELAPPTGSVHRLGDSLGPLEAVECRSPPRELLFAFAQALNDETRDFLVNKSKPLIRYYVEEKKNDYESKTLQCPARWLMQLADLRWVLAGERGPFRPCDVLPPGSPPEEGTLIATLPAGLVEKLPGLAFRKPLANANPTERLCLLGPATGDPGRLATLLDEAREEGSRSDANRRELLTVLSRTELFPARDGTRRRYGRLVGPKQTAVHRGTDLGGFLLWTDDLGGPVADAVERLEMRRSGPSLRSPPSRRSSRSCVTLGSGDGMSRSVRPTKRKSGPSRKPIATSSRIWKRRPQKESTTSGRNGRKPGRRPGYSRRAVRQRRECRARRSRRPRPSCRTCRRPAGRHPGISAVPPDEQHRTARWLDLRFRASGTNPPHRPARRGGRGAGEAGAFGEARHGP